MARHALRALLMGVVVVLTASSAGGAPAQQKQAKLSAAQCQAIEADLRAAAGSVEVHAPATVPIFEGFEIDIRTRSALAIPSAASPRIVVALSGPAHFEDANATIYEAGEEDFHKTAFEKSKPRLFVDFATQKIRVRAFAAGRVTLAWIVLGPGGDCPQRELSPLRREIVVDVREEPRAAAIAASDNPCAAEEAQLRQFAQGTAVEVERKPAVAVGEGVALSWKSEALPLIGRPLWLVVTTEDTVRLEGRGFFVIPPGAPSPASMRHGADRLRLFVPLHLERTPPKGALKIKPYRAGPLAIDYAIVSATACGEKPLLHGDRTVVNVTAGKPEIVVQDAFSTEIPSKVILSKSGQYRLEVFKDSLRVIELETGAKLFEAHGRAPNLSPTSRFVAARTGTSDDGNFGGRFEVFDLVAGEPVDFGDEIKGPIIGWALHDALLVEGSDGHPTLHLRHSYVDAERQPDDKGQSRDGRNKEPRHVEFGSSGRGDSAWERFQFAIHLDAGLVAWTDEGRRTYIGNLATGHTFRADRASLPGLLRSYGAAQATVPTEWHGVELSHYSPTIDRRNAQDREIKRKPQRAYVVEHPVAAPARDQRLALADRVDDWRLRVARGMVRDPSSTQSGRADSRFAEALAAHGVRLAPAFEPEALVTKTVWPPTTTPWDIEHRPSFKKPPARILAELTRDVPEARKYVDTLRGYGACWKYLKDAVAPSWTLKDQALGIWTWSLGPRKYWLVQMLCYFKGGISTSLYLFERGPDQRGRVVDLFEPLLRSAEGADERVRVRPSIIDSRWLVVAAPAGGAIGILDLNDPREIRLLERLGDMEAIDRTYLSTDAALLVQLNTNGLFHLLRTAAGRTWTEAGATKHKEEHSDRVHGADSIVSGRWIDDEILLYTDAGYYTGSYEASHFVHLRFPGVAGLYRLGQFASALEGKGLIARLLSGEQVEIESPRLGVPPSLEVTAVEADGARLRASVKAASSQGLRALRVYQDGKLTDEIALADNSTEMTIDVARFAHARALAMVALDARGFESLPFSAPLPAAAGDNTLHLIAVGIDRYADPLVPRLQSAGKDARGIVAAAKAAAGGYYAGVQATELLDGAASAAAILAMLEEKVRLARPQDTIMFFFAGHGERQDDRLYLVSSSTRVADMAGTGLDWAKVADVLARSSARVVVILDACHSGQSGAQQVVTNDQAVDVLTGKSRTPLLVIAASKGRQASEELANRGGVFTQSVVEAITRGRAAKTANSKGTIDISELYGAVKLRVQQFTRGRQTPWLVRAGLYGDFPIF